MTASLFDANGQRLYITQSERNAFLEAASNADREVRTFCMVMAYTGCRISEALALTGKSIDFGQKAIVFETLKKRKAGVYGVSSRNGKYRTLRKSKVRVCTGNYASSLLKTHVGAKTKETDSKNCYKESESLIYRR